MVIPRQYEVKHYDDHAHWATIWKGKPVKEHEARHVIFTMPVSTAQGQVPRWHPWSGQEREVPMATNDQAG